MLSSRVNYDQIAANAAHLILSSSDKRYAVTFYPSSLSVVWITNEPTPIAGQGIALLPGAAPVRLCVEDDGDTVQKEWYAIYSGPISPIAFVETLYCGEAQRAQRDRLMKKDGW